MSKEENKPLYKKTWFIVVSIIVVLAIIGGLSGEDTNESGVPDDTDLKDSNTPQQENSEISEYQKVLESYKELTEQKSEITSKYLDNMYFSKESIVNWFTKYMHEAKIITKIIEYENLMFLPFK